MTSGSSTRESIQRRSNVGSGDLLVRRLYLGALGAACLVAFVSLWVQITSLVGERGILPVTPYLEAVHEQLGSGAYRRLPTLCWLNSSDSMLTGLCAAGTCLSACLVVGIAPRAVLLALWAVYLSLCVAGQTFLSFQWDTLLLEATFCSVLYAPAGFRRNRGGERPPLTLARWLLWGLAFKLMFLSGVTKLLSADPTWGGWTALNYHYFTQPLPNWVSWYAHHLPEQFHQFSLAVMFLVEIGLPFLVFAGRRGRAVFAVSTILLMAAIQASGNFGFFNLLTAVVCLPLLDDAMLRRLLPWSRASAGTQPAARPKWRALVGTLAGGLLLLVSLMTLVREMTRTQRAEKMPIPVVRGLVLAERTLLNWGEPGILGAIAPFRTINGYGLFRVMTTRRPEIVIEYSRDGVSWNEYEFPYKPGRVDRAPRIVAPHMPRLDWQMWFAALDPPGQSRWLSSLAERILEGNRSTAALMENREIALEPPQFVRLAYYAYEFSTPDQRRESGVWWVRTRQGELTGPLSRQASNP